MEAWVKLSAALQGWLGQSPQPPVVTPDGNGVLSAEIALPKIALPSSTEPRPPWSAARLAVTDQLWGNGYIVPGGEIEILRLVRPLGLSSESSLLVVGVGGGGTASSVVRNTGAWVTGLESDPILVKKAQALMKAAQLSKRGAIDAWDPASPKFARRRHNHCLALDALRRGDQPEPILDGIAQALKPGGQLVLSELVAATSVPTNDADFSRWARLERRKLTAIPTANAITRMLARVGFDVRIAEDISDRHMHNAMIGWRVLVRDLEETRPTPMVAAQLVAEAEMWLLRARLLREKRLTMMRWHAMGRAVSRAPAA